MIDGFLPANTAQFGYIYELLAKGTTDDTMYSKTYAIAWQLHFDPHILIGEGYAVLAYRMDGNEYYCTPLAADAERYLAAVERLEKGGVTAIDLALDWQAELLRGRGYHTEPVRSMWEYVYSPQLLIDLPGKAYHAKRNFINGFGNAYEFRAYREDDLPELKRLMTIWTQEHLGQAELMHPDASWSYLTDAAKMSDYDMENEALFYALMRKEEFGLVADVLAVDGAIAGFCAGELLPGGVGAIYFQKGDTRYKGIYAVLDNLFIKKHFAEARYINKQEDMGIEGLRRAKENYHPIKMIERYIAVKES